MPKLYTARRVVAVLKRHGFIFVSQKGRHAKYRKYDKKVLTVIVLLHHKEIPAGTFSSILRQSNLIKEDFE